MKEYEKKVKYSNNYYHLKFLQDREKMFNPKLSLKKNNNSINNFALSNIFKLLKESQKQENSSLDLIENSEIKINRNSLNLFQKSSSSKKLFFNDEQKNPETLDHNNISKIKTPFKLRNNFLLSSKTNIPKTKLQRKFTAIPKILKKEISKEKNIKQNILKFKNDIKFFQQQLEKRKTVRTNSAKNVNIYLHHIDRSLNTNNKNRKWILPFKKQNLINNKYIFNNKGNKPNKNLNKNIQKNIMDVKIISCKNKNKEKDKNIMIKNKTNVILSFTEQTQNDNKCHKKRKKFPIIM